MNYFFDCEFCESPGKLIFISMAMIRGDGESIYVESKDFKKSDANDWVKENVFPHLKWRFKEDPESFVKKEGKHTDVFGTTEEIADALKKFLSKSRDDSPIFWSYYADYDWVVFCQLFGSMVNLPKHFPMYCRDLMQYLDDLKAYDDRPEQKGTEHDPMADAEYHKELYDFIVEKSVEEGYNPFNV